MTSFRNAMLIMFISIILLLMSMLVFAQSDTTAQQIVISNGWVRPSEMSSAAYFHLHNQGTIDSRLIGVATDIATASIHETMMQDDVMRMRPMMDGVLVPANETVFFEPGGLHIMLMELDTPLVVGDMLQLTLQFVSGEQLEIVLPVLQQAPPLTQTSDALTQNALDAVSEDIYVGQVVNPPIQVRDFEAPSNFPNINHFSDTDGTWRLIFFGYLHCPDFCPLTLVEYDQVKDLLGDDAEAVTFMLISVDAVRDTPDVMQSYLDHFDPAFVGLMPDDATLINIQPDYGFYYERRMDSGSQAIYTVDHSTRSYLVDPDGLLRASFAYDIGEERLASALRWYMQRYETQEE